MDILKNESGSTAQPGNEDSGMFAPQIAIAVLISIVMVVSLTGNSLVLMVIINTRSLRRLNNMLIVSLATIDLVRSVVVMPLFIVVELSVVTQLPKGLCPMYHALHLSCEMVSIYNLTVISLERVFVISRPLVYQLMITLRKMAVLVCVLWVLGFVYGSLQIVWFIPKKDIPEFSGFNPSAYAYQDSSEDGVCQYAPSPEYAIVDFVICLVAPLLIMISCYLKIFCVVQSQMKRIAPTSTNIDCSDIMTYHPEPSHTPHDVSEEPLSTPFRRDTSQIREEEEPQRYDALQRENSTESSKSAYTELKPTDSPHSPELLINVTSLMHSNTTCSLTPPVKMTSSSVMTPVEVVSSGHRSMSVPNVQPLQHRQLTGGLQPALKRSNSGRQLMQQAQQQGKRGSVTFNLDATPDAEASSCLHATLGKLRIVSADDDTNFSSSEATTTDTSLSGQSAAALKPATSFSSHRSSFSSSVAMTQRSRMRINSSASIMTNTSTKSKRGLFRLSDNKAVRMTSIVVGAFMICWLPYNIIFLLKQMHPDCVSALTWDIFSSLVFLSSAINPFIYNFYSGEFRRALRRILTCTDKTNIPWA